MTLFIALAVGMAVGVVVGALGAGGGILAVPVLVYLLGQEPQAAATGSLAIIFATAVTSLLQRARGGDVRWGVGLAFGLLGIAGSVLGSIGSVAVPGPILMGSFAVLLACVGVLMLWRGRAARRASDDDVPDQRGLWDTPAQAAKIIGAATATGLLTGFFGVGGGFAVVPVLTLLLGFGMRQAASTSLVVLAVASLAGLVARAPGLASGSIDVDWLVVAAFALGSIVGGLVGGPLARRARQATLTTAFGVLLLIVAAATAIETALGH